MRPICKISTFSEDLSFLNPRCHLNYFIREWHNPPPLPHSLVLRNLDNFSSGAFYSTTPLPPPTIRDKKVYRVFAGFYARLHKEFCKRTQKFVGCRKCYSSPLHSSFNWSLHHTMSLFERWPSFFYPIVFSLRRIYLQPFSTKGTSICKNGYSDSALAFFKVLLSSMIKATVFVPCYPNP